MLSIDKVTMKNFYSVGNIPQTVYIRNGKTTLIVGDNQDYGDDESGSIRNGVGKAQPLYSKIRVANGWKTMKEIKVGDIVQTPDGHTAVVMGKYPQGKRKVYSIKTKDGKETHACKEHLWELSDGHVVNTQDMYRLMKSDNKVYLPLSCPDMDNSLAFNVDPYKFGVFLVSFEHTENPDTPFSINTFENEIIAKIGSTLVDFEESKLIKQYFDTSHKKLDSYVHKLDTDTKIDILRGVCDLLSEPDPNDQSSIVLYLSNKNLARDLQELFWSVGSVCTMKHKVAFSKEGDDYFSDNNIILTIKHPKLSQFHSYEKFKIIDKEVYNEVQSITLKGEDEVCCIKISSERQLYITDDYIPTHNTTVINAISYALYGATITKPRKKAAIINYFNNKDMLVTINFSVNGVDYYIERGQKPNVMKFVKLVNGVESDVLQQGSNSNTDAEIEKIIGISHLLMKYVMLMSTYSEPFMAEEAAKQRAIIEELLGIGELSIKAERITEKERELKTEIEKETVRIQTIIESNSRVQRTVNELLTKEKQWIENQERQIQRIADELERYNTIDIEKELNAHKNNELSKEINNTINILQTEKRNTQQKLDRFNVQLTKLNNQLSVVEHKSKCHACNQDLTQEMAEEQKSAILIEVDSLLKSFDEESRLLAEIDKELEVIKPIPAQPTVYKSVNDALNHEKTLELIRQELNQEIAKVCPYTEQREVMENTDYNVIDVDYSILEQLEKTSKHYKFLKKLLTHKDSFLRKTIINQSLSYLNERLEYYLKKLRLPHHVIFDANLSFDITYMGVDTDYSLLSRGEQNRVTYALNLAFRDIFELTRYRINVLFVDELLDFGVDSSGAIAGLQILKDMSYTNDTATFLVTHKEELMERVSNTIYVKKENGFTTYSEEIT